MDVKKGRGPVKLGYGTRAATSPVKYFRQALVKGFTRLFLSGERMCVKDRRETEVDARRSIVPRYSMAYANYRAIIGFIALTRDHRDRFQL